jgi:hypothetical protein
MEHWPQVRRAIVSSKIENLYDDLEKLSLSSNFSMAHVSVEGFVLHWAVSGATPVENMANIRKQIGELGYDQPLDLLKNVANTVKSSVEQGQAIDEAKGWTIHEWACALDEAIVDLAIDRATKAELNGDRRGVQLNSVASRLGRSRIDAVRSLAGAQKQDILRRYLRAQNIPILEEKIGEEEIPETPTPPIPAEARPRRLLWAGIIVIVLAFLWTFFGRRSASVAVERKTGPANPTVRVEPPQVNLTRIETFEASPTTIGSGQSKVVLKWRATNARAVFLDRVSVSHEGTKAISGLTSSRKFVLTVIDASGKQESRTVEVLYVAEPKKPIPAEIVQFGASPAQVDVTTQRVVLSWFVRGAAVVNLNEQRVEPKGTRTLSPPFSNKRRFVLSAANSDGAPLTKVVTLGVSEWVAWIEPRSNLGIPNDVSLALMRRCIVVKLEPKFCKE